MLPVIRIINYKIVPNKLTLIYDELKCDGGDFGLGQDGIDPSLSAPPSQAQLKPMQAKLSSERW